MRFTSIWIQIFIKKQSEIFDVRIRVQNFETGPRIIQIDSTRRAESIYDTPGDLG